MNDQRDDDDIGVDLESEASAPSPVKASPPSATSAEQAATIVTAMLDMLGPDARAAFDRKVWESRDTDIKYQGTKIILPSSPKEMPIDAAIAALQRKKRDLEQLMDVVEQIDAYPFDAAVALVKAMAEIYGWASPVPTPGFFGPTHPDLITVRTGPGPRDSIQVPMGSFSVPGIEKNIMCHVANAGEHGARYPVLCIHGQVRKREQRVLKDLVARAKEILARESIYKGKALRLHVGGNGRVDRGVQPDFISTAKVRPHELIFSESVQAQLDVSLWTPIKFTNECIRHGIPLKRTVLMEGTYGTGKTMTGSVTSKIAVDNSWTFILVDSVKGLRDALEFAVAYQPAVVFAEDIDRETGSRTSDRTNELLNVISGVVSKNAQIITVLTTNHVELIHPAFLRPERIDAVVSVQPPDPVAVGRLVHLYARGLVDPEEPLSRIGDVLKGEIPATIREVVERAKLAMIAGGRQLVIEDDLLTSAAGMKRHLELLNRSEVKVLSAGERMGRAMVELLSGVNTEALKAAVDNIDETISNVGAIMDRVDSSIATAASGDGKIVERIDRVVRERLKPVHDKLDNLS